METKAVKVEVSARAMSQAPSSGFLSTVYISQNREVEEFIIDESTDTFTSLGSYPDSSPLSDPLLFHNFQNFTPNYIYQRLHNQFNDHDLSQLISDQIVFETQRRDLPQEGPLFMMVSVKLTHKVYFSMSCSSASSKTTLEEPETCAICLEDMSESETKPISQMPNCSHMFHEECVINWLDRRHNSCPLCRQPVYGNESEENLTES